MTPPTITAPNGGISLPPNTTGGAQPTNRLADASRTLQMISRRATQLGTKWAVWKEVRDKYDCLPPDTAESLRANGLGNTTNVCWGTMESRVDEIVETYYNLANGGRTFLKFHSRETTPQAASALKTLSAEHKILWDLWNGRQEMMETLVFNRSLFPFSAVYWDQPDGWWCRALDPRNLIYPENAGTDVDQWFWCAVKTSFEAWELLKKLEDESAASTMGWRPQAIRKACEAFCKEGTAALASTGTGLTWGTVSYNDIMPHDLTFNDRIPAFVVYVREWNGKVSEHILVDHKEVGYIYTRPSQHERLSDNLRIFAHSLGAGTLDSVRSYGVKTLHYHDALDRLSNAEYDTALITSSLILQNDGGTGADKLADIILNMGGVTAIPSGFTPAQVSFRDSAAGIRLLQERLQRQLSRNTPSLAGDVEVGEYEKSQREAAMVYQTQLQLGLFKIDRFRQQMDGFSASHWRRLLACLDQGASDLNGAKEAKEFFKMAANLGITPEFLGSIYRVTHRTGSARGNRVNAQLGMDRSRQYFGMFSEDGKRDFAKKDISLALDDEDEADSWLNSGQMPDAEQEQARMAMLENSSMTSGQPVIAAGTDMDVVHMDAHTGWAASEIKACDEGQRDPAACLKAITLALQHVQSHMQRLSQDKYAEEQFAQLGEQWSQVENYRRKLEQQLAMQQQEAMRAQEEAARTPQIDPKDAQKLAAGQQAMMQKEFEHQQKMRHTEEDHRAKMEGATQKREGAAVGAER